MPTDIVLDLPNFNSAWSPDGNGIVTYNRSGGARKPIARGTDPSWGAGN